MSDGKDDNIKREFCTVDMAGLEANDASDVCTFRVVVGEDVKSGDRSMPITNIEDFGKEEYNKSIMPNVVIRKPKMDRRTSLIWTKFTILSKKDRIAVCNICDERMSYKSTSHNLKKHLERKHNYSVKSDFKFRPKKLVRYITPTPRPQLSELSHISDEEGLAVEVVGESGEEDHFQLIAENIESEEVVHGDVQEHDYSTNDHSRIEEEEVVVESEPLRIQKVTSLSEPQSSRLRRDPQRLYIPPKTSTSFLDDKSKRQRIMELQIECLENSKYNMQLQALLMEQQLNMTRSIFTESLHYKDNQTRSTQTEVGGSDTKVFYVTNKRDGRPIQQLFALQDMDV